MNETNPAQLVPYVTGGAFLLAFVFGAVAITGFSTLALGSIITFLAIVAGSAATMKYRYWRMTTTEERTWKSSSG